MFKLVGKNLIVGGPGYQVVNISITVVCGRRILFYAKMLIEIEKTLSFVAIIFIIGSILIKERAGLLDPFGYAYDEVGSQKSRHGKLYSSTAPKPSIEFTAEVFFP